MTDAVLPLDVGRQADAMGRALSTLAEALQGRLDLAPLIAGAAPPWARPPAGFQALEACAGTPCPP